MNKYRETCFTSPTRKKIPGKIDDPNNVDFVSSKANSSRKEALLYIFEDNEAVIKMIIKGIRESEKLKTVLELYDLETHQKKLGPDYHRLKTMVKKVSSKKFEIRILVSGMEILKRTPWSRIREQNSVYKEFLEIVGAGKPTGSV